MALTLTEAFNRLGQCNTVADIQSLVGQVSGKVPGIATDTQHLLYSGGTQSSGGTWTGSIANELAGNGTGRYVTVSQSEVGQFLNHPDFLAKLSQLSGFKPDETGFKALLNGGVDSATGTRLPDGLWDIASKNYVLDADNGQFRVIAPFAKADSTYAQVELRALVERMNAPGIVPTTVEGLPQQNLISIYNAALTNGNEASALDALQGAIKKGALISPDPLVVSAGNVNSLIKGGMTMAEFSAYLESSTKLLAKAGPAGVALSALVIASEANAAYSQGETTKGNSIVAAWAAEMGAGWAAGAAAGSAAFYATAWLNSFGPVGTAANFLITVSAGIYGGYVGGEAAANLVQTLMQENGVTSTEGPTQRPIVRFTNGVEYRPASWTAADGTIHIVGGSGDVEGTWSIPNTDGTVTKIGSSADNKYFTFEQKSSNTPDAAVLKRGEITIDAGGVHNKTLTQNGWTTVTTDPVTKKITSNSTAVVQPDGSSLETVTYTSGRIVRITTDKAGNTTQEIVPTATESFISTTATLIDAMSLIKAIQSGEPLPVLSSGLRLANDLTSVRVLNDPNNPNGGSHMEPTNATINGAANAAGGILSLMSLDAALKRGDGMAAITAGAQAISYSATAYASFSMNTANVTADVITTAFGETVGSAINGINTALPYLNIVNSIAHGDAVGAAMGAIAMTPAAPIAWAYYGFQMITGLFSDNTPPEAWGTAAAHWVGYDAVTRATGAYGGLESATATYDTMLAYLDQLVAQEQTLNPGKALGIVANRLPSISYRNYTGYSLTDTDPLTGVQNAPGTHYDLNGRPYNAPAGTEQASQSLTERMVRTALGRGAIAPMWEVQTAALQTAAGDPMAGLTEEERAGRAGKLAPALTNTDTTQTFRPVALNIDDTGYLKNTAWLNNNDAFLYLDRNLNGQMDGGRELFSNGAVALSERGLQGLRWIDSNYDGKLSALDPVWDQLKVWQDANGDGVSYTDTNANGQYDATEPSELKTLTQLGITELNYAMGTFKQNGTDKQLASPDLVADAQGTITYSVPEGIVVQTSQGQTSLLVTQVDDKSLLEANRDGVTGYEDTETIISAADLLTNDTLAGMTGQDLSITDVSGFTHGTGYLDANGFIHYTPTANYFGAAQFNYTLKAATGQTATATVDLTIKNINDAPVATVRFWDAANDGMYSRRMAA